MELDLALGFREASAPPTVEIFISPQRLTPSQCEAVMISLLTVQERQILLRREKQHLRARSVPQQATGTTANMVLHTGRQID